MWSRHIANCAVVAQEELSLIPSGTHIADVGSGAGLPGIVWALVRPDVRVTLVEPLLRRATFLTEVVEELGLGQRVIVQRARAEQAPGTFPVVTARAVARLGQLIRWTAPLTEVGGWIIALKGASAADEVSEVAPELVRSGCGPAQIRTYGSALLDAPTTAVLIPRIEDRASGQERAQRTARRTRRV